MRSLDNDSMLIVEGGGMGRLSLLRISGDSGHLTTLREGYPDGAVSVTVIGNTAYVLEGQLRLMLGPSDAQPPTKPFHATAVKPNNP
jgi:hypothetical protein